MADNPLSSGPEHENRIRERAYYLWLQDGCPEGRAEEYWERARELQAIEDSKGAGQTLNPMTQNNGQVPPAQPVEEASIQQNLGEFPGPTTDQGDRPQTPIVEPVSGAPATEASTQAPAAPPAPKKRATKAAGTGGASATGSATRSTRGTGAAKGTGKNPSRKK
jgi:Protein of unknown function (DUF2934)